MIRFEESGHKYLYGDIVLKSATTAIGEYFSEFNSDYTSRTSAYKELIGSEKYLSLRKQVFGYEFKPDPSEIFPLFDNFCKKQNYDVNTIRERFLFEWKQSGILGTDFHKKREFESISRGFEVNPFTGENFKTITFEKQYDNQIYSMDLMDLPDGYYSELLLFDKNLPLEYTVAGQADRVWIETVGGVRYTDVGDWKTNPTKPAPSKYSRCKPPFEHLWSNTVVKYSFQISYYQAMLKSHGFVPRNNSFTHITDYDVNKQEEFPVIFMEREVELLREEIRKNVG